MHMEQREYRLSRLIGAKEYVGRACYGLMQVERINQGMVYPSAKACREAIKAHAARDNVKPMIITDTV